MLFVHYLETYNESLEALIVLIKHLFIGTQVLLAFFISELMIIILSLQQICEHPICMLQLQGFLLRLFEGLLIPKQLRTFLVQPIIL